MNWENKQIIFTRHTSQRLAEFQVSFEDGLKMFAQSVREKIKDKNMRNYKREKYQDNGNVFYTRSGTFIFTVTEGTNFKTNKPCWLVITATNQLINLKKYV